MGVSETAPGQIVLYRDPLGFDCPAIITGTFHSVVLGTTSDNPERQLNNERLVRRPSTTSHVHLTVFSPLTALTSGAVQMHDVPEAPEWSDPKPGTWRSLTQPGPAHD